MKKIINLAMVDALREEATKMAAMPERYSSAIEAITKSLGELSNIIGSLSKGDTQEIDKTLSKWEDVQRTYDAIEDLEKELKNIGMDWEEVLEFAIKLLPLVAQVAALA